MHTVPTLYWFPHDKQLTYERFSLPGHQNHELQVTTYPTFVCMAVVDYETGMSIFHTDFELEYVDL